MGPPLRLWKQAVLSALLIAGAALLWQGRAQVRAWIDDAPAAAPADQHRRLDRAPVIVAPVTTAADDLTVEVVGTGRAVRSVMLRADAAGKVVESELSADRHFAAGAPMLRLDDREQRLALALAEARLAEAARNRDRYARLRKTGATAAMTFDEAETAAAVARIEVDRAHEQLDDRTLKAPYAGVAGLPRVEVGDRITMETDVVTFDDRSALLVEFELPEALLARVRVGMAVSARTPSAPHAAFAGVVRAIDSRVDATTRSARVRVEIPNEGDALRPGASFVVRLDLPGARYPRVPELALQFARGGMLVWRVADGAAEPVTVTLVRRRAGEALLDGPLRDGDLVVVEGVQRLRPGTEVEVVGGADGGADAGTDGLSPAAAAARATEKPS